MLMSNVCLLISLDLNLMNATSLVVLKKPKVITFSTPPRTKCLLLIVVFFLRENFFLRRTVGVKYNSKKFEKHRRWFHHLRKMIN